jgi:PAS domain S-box-containing protein
MAEHTLARRLASTEGFIIQIQLREEAENRLKTGSAPKNGGHALGQDALGLLYRLSSDPESAGDALKLLHELQVHQVELDLQMHQIKSADQELADALQRFQMLYDLAPFAYFVVDLEGQIAQANAMGIELTGVGRDDLAARRIDSFLQPESRSALLALLRQAGTSPQTIEVTMTGAHNAARVLLITAQLAQDTRHILLACCEYPRAGQS